MRRRGKRQGDEEGRRDLCSRVGSAEERPCLLPDQRVMSEDVLSRQISPASLSCLPPLSCCTRRFPRAAVRLGAGRRRTSEAERCHSGSQLMPAEGKPSEGDTQIPSQCASTAGRTWNYLQGLKERSVSLPGTLQDRVKAKL